MCSNFRRNASSIIDDKHTLGQSQGVGTTMPIYPVPLFSEIYLQLESHENSFFVFVVCRLSNLFEVLHRAQRKCYLALYKLRLDHKNGISWALSVRWLQRNVLYHTGSQCSVGSAQPMRFRPFILCGCAVESWKNRCWHFCRITNMYYKKFILMLNCLLRRGWGNWKLSINQHRGIDYVCYFEISTDRRELFCNDLLIHTLKTSIFVCNSITLIKSWP